MVGTQYQHSQEEGEFFKGVDRLSVGLRNGASDLARFVGSIKNPPQEIKKMKLALERISSCDIEQLDIAINELKNSIDLFNSRLHDKAFADIVGAKKIQGIILKEKKLLDEASRLVQQADALLKSGG